MAFTLHLRPDLEKNLAEQAQVLGVPVERYIQMLIERQIALQVQEHKISAEALEVELDGLAAYSEKIPLLPLSALTRDEIYRDRD